MQLSGLWTVTSFILDKTSWSCRYSTCQDQATNKELKAFEECGENLIFVQMSSVGRHMPAVFQDFFFDFNVFPS